jgi:cytochrome c-type biogenesis protein CcmH/NrfG
MWEEAIECLKSMEKRARAEKLVRERLDEEPGNPTLWCLLGDLLQDPAAYERAWTVSKFRHARAMRSLGSYFFKRNQDKECIECYRKALAINPLFGNSWFVMGCAAARIQEYEIAAEAFTRVVALDDDNSEAWNNLASIYIRQQKKTEAFNALQQALKHSYDNWKMWQNFMFTATDLHDFTEAIKAAERVVELRATKDGVGCVDFEVLRILVDAVKNGTKTFDGRKATFLTERLTSVLDLMTSKISTSPELWMIMGDFAGHNQQDRKALEAHQKAYRCISNNNDVNHSDEAFDQLCKVTTALVDALERYGPSLGEDWKHQIRMTLRSITGRTKLNWQDDERWITLKTRLDNL